MKAIANVKFREVIGIIEDIRLNLTERRRKIVNKKQKGRNTQDDEIDFLFDHSFGIWKCIPYLNQAAELKKWMDESYQKDLINDVELLFGELLRDRKRLGIILTKDNRDHIGLIYKNLLKYDVLKKDEKGKKKLKGLYDKLVTIKKRK